MAETVAISKTAFIDFQVMRNDTFFFDFQVQNQDDEGLDLSFYDSAKMEIVNEKGNTIIELNETSGITLNLSAGQITLNFATDLLVDHFYKYDLELSNEQQTTTIISGKIYLLDDYSN